MREILIKLAPVFIGFGLAIATKKLGVLKADYGNMLLKFGFYVTIPALVFVSVSQLGFDHSLLIFFCLPAIVIFLTFPLATLIAKRLHVPRSTEGTLRVAPMTINSGLALVFLTAAFGGEGVTRVVLFNTGFNPLLLIFVYGLAASYNPKTKKRRDVLKRILILPPLWALVIGILVNIGNLTVPSALLSVLGAVGSITPFITIVALGLLFNPLRLRFDKTLAILGMRVGFGLLIGMTVCTLLKLQGIDRAAALTLCAAPIGYNLLTFAATEKLDQTLAANAVSLSIVVGLILTPLLLVLAN